MQEIYWVVEEILAGSTGPNHDVWHYDTISRQSFSAVLSVNNGEMVDGRRLAEMGINHAVIPMTHRAPVEQGDLERCLLNLPLAIEFIHRNSAFGPVLLHCRSGKDRTGMVSAAYLIRYYGHSVEEAMQAILKVRPIAYTATGWMDFVREVLTAYKQQ